MRVRQRAYLRLASDGLTPDGITELLGVEPSEAKAKGSRHVGPPPVPRSHLWSLHSAIGDEAPLEDHFSALWPRLAEIADGLQQFTARADSTGWFQIVRYFEEGEEDFDEATWGLEADADYQRVAGQHPFLSFGLDVVQLQFLASIGLGIDVDEYG